MSSTRKGTFNPVRVIAALAGIGLLLQLSGQALSLVKAGAFNSQTEQYLDFWREKEKKDPDNFSPKQRDFDIALRGADQALTALPDAPESWVLKAHVLEWGQQYNLIATADTVNAPALASWQHAISLRPAWPYAWNDYAMARAQLSLIDKDFETALIRANQLGPWERRVLETSATLGEHYRGWLTPTLQTELDNSMIRLTQIYPGVARQIRRSQE